MEPFNGAFLFHSQHLLDLTFGRPAADLRREAECGKEQDLGPVCSSGVGPSFFREAPVVGRGTATVLQEDRWF